MSDLAEIVPITPQSLARWSTDVEELYPDIGKMAAHLREFDVITQAAIVGHALGQLCYPVIPGTDNALYAAWLTLLDRVSRARHTIRTPIDPPALHRAAVRRGDFTSRRRR